MPPLVRPTRPPALASGGEHHLTQRGTACETTEAEGQHWRPTASADDRGNTIEPTPSQAGQISRSDRTSPLALRHGRIGATAIKNSRVKPIGMVI